ncbi:ead/Ea22-like family protein [Serratia marcescens]|uniref:ead/Ea22-like family protein n=1 Tax=Serratia marcescens TaxID=615 RepID=UPI0027E49D09|nr:ead/Ea22-like family protein [Serratia marcescens]HEJ7171049.1 ead/Ea22-like family protein [Serratia marcescens]
MDKFSELKAAAMAATQGAWERGWDNDTGPNDNYFVEWQTAGPASFYKDNAENDADFASNATPETILALLAELEFEKQNNAGVAGMVEDYETKLAEKDKRIAELEAKTAMTMGVGSGNGSLFVHGDYDSIKAAQAIVLENESLRAKLATPVRLLGEMLLHDWEHRVERQAAFEHRKIAWDARLAEDKKAILAAGFTFTVDGDE